MARTKSSGGRLRNLLFSCSLSKDDLGRAAGSWHVVARIQHRTNRVCQSDPTLPALRTPRFAQEQPALYADISSQEKLLVKGQRPTHFLLFERNHKVVHRAFAEFLTKGTVNGRQGLVTVDREGKYVQ